MSLLIDAANAWATLCGISYIIELGHRGKQETIKLTFKADEFPHLVGMHYAKSVDLGMRPNEYYGGRLIPAVLNGKITESQLKKSPNWPRIEGRLRAITNIQRTLEGDFLIARFSQSKVRGNSRILAEYVIKNSISGEVFFVLLNRDDGGFYCISAFQFETVDYMENQSRMTVLKVTRQTATGREILRRHPNYKPAS